MGHESIPSDRDASEVWSTIQWPPLQNWPQHRPVSLAVMASGEGSNFEALVLACRHGPLQATVELLVVNEPGCGALGRAERLEVASQLLDHRGFGSREQLDQALVTSFRSRSIDLVVMAGWMRIVTPVLIEAFPGRLINIHPSLLPSFRGLDAVGQALAAGVRLSGCTAHHVCAEVDAGEILVQAAVPVLSGDDRSSLAARIHRQEHRILPLAVALAARQLETGSGQLPQG